MIDIHVHAIPMVDDGPESFEESLEFLRYAADNGINRMIATPHYFYPNYTNKNVLTNYNMLQEHIKRSNIGITLHLGNEVYLSEEGVSDLLKGHAKTLAGSGYVLIELPVDQYYPFHDDLITKLQHEGYKVIIAHVERYRIFNKNFGKLKDLVRKGVYTQINSSFIIDKATRHRAFELISSGCVHIVASDGHNLMYRKPILKEAYDIVSKKYSKETAETMFIGNPYLLIEDSPSLLDI